MKTLKANLKSLLKKEKYLVDIFLFGSAFKGKEKPNDIDIIALFRDNNYELIERVLYQIKKVGEKLEILLHIEPIVVDQLHNQKAYPFLLHEGFSLRNMKFLHELLGFKPFVLITYNLEDKTPSEKVRFSYALYGRKEGDGLLKKLKGKVIGKGSFLIPINQQAAIKSFFELWNTKYKEQRLFIFS